jgi:hypothetical protein
MSAGITALKLKRTQFASAHKLPVKWESRPHRCAAKLKRTQFASAPSRPHQCAAKLKRTQSTSAHKLPVMWDYSPRSHRSEAERDSPFTILHKSWRTVKTEAALYSFRFVFLERIPDQPVRRIWQHRCSAPRPPSGRAHRPKTGSPIPR